MTYLVIVMALIICICFLLLSTFNYKMIHSLLKCLNIKQIQKRSVTEHILTNPSLECLWFISFIRHQQTLPFNKTVFASKIDEPKLTDVCVI